MRLLKILVLILLMQPLMVHAESKHRFALFIPDDTPFWSRVALFAGAASEDLEVDLTVFDADANRLLMANQITSAAKKSTKFDLLIFPNFIGTAATAIPECEKNAIPCILFNSPLSDKNVDRFKGPGQVYKHWIAQLIPDDVGSANAIATSLVMAAKKRKPGSLNIVGVNGYNSDSPAIKRERGLRAALSKFPQAQLMQVFYTDWSKEDAYNRTKGLLRRYPNIDVIWSANYRTTQGILQALDESNRIVGQDVLVNSYDVDPTSLSWVENGSVHVAAGGHYVEGAWAVVMGYDFLNGIVLSAEQNIVNTPLMTVTKENLAVVKKALVQLEQHPASLNNADFTQFSLVSRAEAKRYRFSLEAALAEIVSQ